MLHTGPGELSVCVCVCVSSLSFVVVSLFRFPLSSEQVQESLHALTLSKVVEAFSVSLSDVRFLPHKFSSFTTTTVVFVLPPLSSLSCIRSCCPSFLRFST